jgi:transposase
MSEQKRNCRRRYDRQFKEDAVALVRSGRLQAQVARDLGVSAGVLSAWVLQDATGRALCEPKTLRDQSPEQLELHRLRQENDYLRQQRDILKKALGILSAEMPASASR